ncbi:MAG: AAA family ATPase [Acidobacteria bacterium]|nr:AAA family ATPase [Acidobacteriota bacterium]
MRGRFASNATSPGPRHSDNPTRGRYVRLYDQENDPGEFTDVARNTPMIVQKMEDLILDRFRRTHPEARKGHGGGGVTERVFGYCLSWLQDKRSPVFVVATANNISGLPPEFLRRGRFDETFFVGLPAVREFSGAGLEQAVVSRLYRAFDAGGNLTGGPQATDPCPEPCPGLPGTTPGRPPSPGLRTGPIARLARRGRRRPYVPPTRRSGRRSAPHAGTGHRAASR